MPNSTNPAAPKQAYDNGQTDKGAAFRPSITVAGAKALLVYPIWKDRLDSVLSRRPKNGRGGGLTFKANKTFQSDPWSAYGGTSGIECDLDGGQIWRLIRSQKSWFLAKHVGANNGFQFWHISDPPPWAVALPSAMAQTGTVVTPPGTPVLTRTVSTNSITSPNTPLVVQRPRAVPDDWEDEASDTEI